MEKRDEEEPLTVEAEILRVNLSENSVEKMKDVVVVESQIELYVNDKHYATFSAIPSMIKELVIGHLLDEGIVSKPEEIMSLEISKGRAHISLTKKNKIEFSDKPQRILTGCGKGSSQIPPHLWMKPSLFKNASGIKLKTQTILGAIGVLNTQARFFRNTGGTHASALLDENGKVIAFSEDIGRHNAVDKVIGEAALKGVDFGKTLLASTGRLTSEIAVKAAQMGIPVIVSISAPTDKGVKIAESAGLTLIGFARGRRFNIYTHPERIEKPSTITML